MKKNLFKTLAILALGTAFIFTSCKKDDDDKNASDFIGTWTCDDMTADVSINGISFVDYMMDEFGYTEAQAELFLESMMAEMDMEGGTLEIRSDGTYFSDMGGEDYEGTWRSTDNNNTLITDEGEEDEMTLDVISLSANQMVLEMNETETEDFDEDGTDDTMVIVMRMTFTK
jgi:hypothetical protein